ncbi:MAG: hypothetical protein HRT57_13560 [Crocinitomicaceae bacterium]|nr:hypothetical protein [Crocinitomicaceae bacterium]
MKWTDKDIDKLYSEGSEGLSFEYKEGYWDEFDAQLSEAENADGAKEPLSDAEIDSVYAASSAGLAFDYKNNYWDEFNASLPDGAVADSPKPALTDTEIDAMYAASAAGLSFDYKGSYWKDFNESFAEDAVLSGNGIDELYQESADDLSFEYKPSYWGEIKGRIRRQRRPDLLWFFTAYSFVGVLGVMAFINANSVSDSNALTSDSNRVETPKQDLSNSLVKIENSNTGNNSSAVSANNGGANSNPSENILLSGSQVVGPINIATTAIPVVSEALLMNPALNIIVTEPIIAQDLASQIPPMNGVGTGVVQILEDPNSTRNPLDPRIGVPSETLSSNDIVTTEEAPKTNEEQTRLPYGSQGPIDILSVNSPLPYSPLEYKRRAFALVYVQGIGGLSQSLVIPSDQISNSFGIGIGTEVHKGNLTFNFGVNAIVENHDVPGAVWVRSNGRKVLSSDKYLGQSP